MLHGEIKVNNIVIGEWTAVRGDIIIDNVRVYYCTMRYRDERGYLWDGDEYEVYHRPNNGALVLAKNVIAAGMLNLKPVPISEEESTEILFTNLISGKE